MIKQVFSTGLRIGMYVSKLDRPWTETPFLFQGFSIKTQEDINNLRKYTTYVYIDTEKDAKTDKRIPTRNLSNAISDHVLPKRSKKYKTKNTVETEIKQAKSCFKALLGSFYSATRQLQSGTTIDIAKLEYAVKHMVQSVIRNPDAFLLLSQLKTVQHYYFNHALMCSVLAVTFGRHLGLSPKELRDLGTGMLLCDVGLINLPHEIVNLQGKMNGDQFELYKTHVYHSVKLLQACKHGNREIIKIAQFHHEYHNGSGYPNGTVGLQIPALARIATLVDFYVSITNPYNSQDAISNLEAIQLLNDNRDIKFQRELVDEFVKSLGVFATGSIVEISTGEIGFVLSQNHEKKLRPKIMLVLDEKQQSLGHLPIVDLSNEETDSHNNFLKVAKSHKANFLGLNLSNYINLQ